MGNNICLSRRVYKDHTLRHMPRDYLGKEANDTLPLKTEKTFQTKALKNKLCFVPVISSLCILKLGSYKHIDKQSIFVVPIIQQDATSE